MEREIHAGKRIQPVLAVVIAMALVVGVPVWATEYPYVEYPFVSRGTAEQYTKTAPYGLADDGVLVTRYQVGGEQVVRHNPAFIGTYGLTAYRDFVERGDPADRQRLLTQAEWLLNNAERRMDEEGEYLVWPYDFDNDVFGAEAPWISGFAQARILVALYYAYRATGDEEYLDAALKAFRVFLKEMPDGGVATRDGDGTWFEEVAGVDVPSSRILNGHNSALAGVWLLYQATQLEEARLAFEQGVAAVRNELPRYDADFLSYYSQLPDNPRRLAGARGYNTTHVMQLLWLYEVSADLAFLEYAFRFASFEDRDMEIAVSASTNASTHGPEHLRFTMGNRYWSSNVFPTSLEIDLGHTYPVRGVLMHGHTSKATPRDFGVFVEDDESGWTPVATVQGNEDQVARVGFDARQARRLKIVIESDNGNRNVALDGVAVVRARSNPIAVSNYRGFSISNRPTAAFGDGWKMPGRVGWRRISAP